MASLSNYFVANNENLLARRDCIISGEKYRISILSDRLVRLEYSENGIFEDSATEIVINRRFEKPNFQVSKNNNIITIVTKYFTLNYMINKPFVGNKVFPGNTLNIKLNQSNRLWYYGHPEARNFGGGKVSLDDFEGKLSLDKGLFSMDGFVSIDDSSSRIIQNDQFVERTNKEIDVYVFMYKKDFGLCLKDYYTLTGMPTMIPRFALGNWYSKNDLYTSDSIQELVERFEKEEIPISILLLQSKWHDEDQFMFSSRIPNAKEMVAFLHEKGLKVAVSVDASLKITPNNSKYEQIKSVVPRNPKKEDIFLVPFNIYSLGVYFKVFIQELNRIGIDFYFNDYNNIKDLYSLWFLQHYHYTSNNSEEKRGLVLSRNSKIAPHRYPVLYSGKTIVNFETLSNLPFYNLSAANMGVSWWAHSVGGYYKGIEDTELYLRSIQLGVFSPILSIISDGGKYHKREPWLLDKGIAEVIQQYLELRYRLIPYIYSEGFAYSKFGSPLIQPLYYKYPAVYDEPLYKNEYFFGSQFFVSPITKQKDLLMNRVIHKVFIPRGMWYDFKTGKKFPGDNYYVTFYKDEDYPIYCKAGSIIVLNQECKNANLPEKLEVHIFPGASNNYKLYEDDGISNLYKDGYYLLTSIDYNYRNNNYTLIIRPIEGKTNIVPEYRDYKIRFRNTKKADDVIVFVDSEKVETNSYINENDFVIEIEHVPTLGQLTINCKGKDIEIDAVRLINEEIIDMLIDLEIETTYKEKIEEIIFSDQSISKKRIAIRKLKKKGLDERTIRMFIRLLEYIKKI